MTNAHTLTLTRGLDLSGTLQGAGGIGGLLARTDHHGAPELLSGGGSPQHTCFHADGNGNITALVDTNQTLVARYAYDPFGNLISMTGPLADANLYRFSSKEAHLASGLVYYLYRYYDPNLQRWVNRDPIEEEGGINLYQFVENNPINDYDIFGLQKPIICPPPVMRSCMQKCASQGKAFGGCFRVGFKIKIKGVPISIFWWQCNCVDPKKLPICHVPE